jgi:hypothetical protein
LAENGESGKSSSQDHFRQKQNKTCRVAAEQSNVALSSLYIRYVPESPK